MHRFLECKILYSTRTFDNTVSCRQSEFEYYTARLSKQLNHHRQPRLPVAHHDDFQPSTLPSPINARPLQNLIKRMEINHERLQGESKNRTNSVKEGVSPAMNEDFKRIKVKKVRVKFAK